MKCIPLLETEVFGEDLPQVLVSTGFTGSRHGLKAIGACWTPHVGTQQIFISPIICHSTEVLGTLCHELIHALHPKDGHKGSFKRTAKRIGLVGPMRSTTVGPELRLKLESIIERLGPYPHESLSVNRPKQSTRMVKISCICGFTARCSSKWVEYGLPTCVCGEQLEADLSTKEGE